jgi:hypothetical protein
MTDSRIEREIQSLQQQLSRYENKLEGIRQHSESVKSGVAKPQINSNSTTTNTTTTTTSSSSSLTSPDTYYNLLFQRLHTPFHSLL